MTVLRSVFHDFRSVFATFFLILAINLAAGCAINTPARDKLNANKADIDGKPAVLSYQGRLSLRIASDPPQSLYAGFSLNGDAQMGDLTLNSPLGNTLAQLYWTPQTAVLKANNETKEFPSASALVENVTGTTIPLSALFDWLAGKNTPAVGWEIDLSGMRPDDTNDGAVQRLVARRTAPLPTADLRIAIDK
jgi:outer membrane lipoprotein LolB